MENILLINMYYKYNKYYKNKIYKKMLHTHHQQRGNLI